VAEAHRSHFSIWFYIGALLTLYGALILGSGLWQIDHPAPGLALQNLHAGVWWGGFLFASGLLYLALFRPRHN